MLSFVSSSQSHKARSCQCRRQFPNKWGKQRHGCTAHSRALRDLLPQGDLAHGACMRLPLHLHLKSTESTPPCPQCIDGLDSYFLPFLSQCNTSKLPQLLKGGCPSRVQNTEPAPFLWELTNCSKNNTWYTSSIHNTWYTSSTSHKPQVPILLVSHHPLAVCLTFV